MDRELRNAKRPTTLLAGPYGHPLHPALVTIPIGAWVGSVVLDVASRFVDDPAAASRAAWWLLALGVLGALAAGTVGFFDLIGITPGTRAWRIALVHLSCTVSATTLFGLAWLLRRDQPAPAEGTSNGYLALSLGALVVLAAGGYLGGELAYRYGVRVADEHDQLAGHKPKTDLTTTE
jgi:uncharacterized membrane protein